MELQIQPYEQAQPIRFNYAELKGELASKLQTYKTLQYTEEQIVEAKKDRAALNRLKTTLNNERLCREKEFMQPFNEFKAQIRELCDLIDEPVSLIDRQVKEYENIEKQAKRDKCKEIFFANPDVPEWVDFEQIENPRWLNKTFSMKQVEDDITEKIKKVNDDIKVLSELEYSFEAIEEYKRTLDLSAAMVEGKRIATMQIKKQAEKTSKTAQIPFVDNEVVEITADEPKAEEKAVWLKFEVLLTKSQAAELNAFFKFNGIDYKPIKEDK